MTSALADNAPQSPVVIVGAGPVGLFLGCCLAARGLAFSLLEARGSVHRHSRAIGVHPPALERFATLGLAEALLERGVIIRRGHAFANTQQLGTLNFASCPPPYPFILSLPQHETEALLQARLEALAPGRLERGLRLVGLSADGEGLTLRLERANGTQEARRARFVVGCDGKDSAVRRFSSFGWRGRGYPDRYLMGDFEDHTDFGADAAIYLCDAGLIESFPLPGLRRRWVVKTDEPLQDAAQLARLIEGRLGQAPAAVTNTMLSAFGVQTFWATPIAKGQVLLCGDAAHLVSPIGGQGMNLGWLDAWAAAETLETALASPERAEEALERYSRQRARAARQAARRAEFNMALGRRTRLARLRSLAVSLMLKPPLERLFARLFTMRGL